MKRIYKIAITFMLMLGFAISTSSAFASFGADYYYLSEPRVSFITDRRTVDVPVTIPSTTILSPSGHSVTFNSFDTICEIKLDVTYNANTGIICSTRGQSQVLCKPSMRHAGTVLMCYPLRTIPNGYPVSCEVW